MEHRSVPVARCRISRSHQLPTAAVAVRRLLTIEHIEEELAGTQLAPGQLADYRIYLAALYSLRASEMQRILAVKPAKWLDLRGEKNSDKATDREWQVTMEGQRETQLKWELRRIDKLSGAISTKLRVMEGEARNNY